MELLRPSELSDVGGGVYLHGGTELVPLMQDGLVSATTLIDVRGVVPRGVTGRVIGAGTTLGELEHACKENRLVTLPGFGDKTQANVLAGVQAERRHDGMHLREWERSAVRNELMERGELFVTGARVQRTVGVDEWFEAAANARPHAPAWRRVFSDVAWVYPVSFVLAWLVAPWYGSLPLPARVLIGATR